MLRILTISLPLIFSFVGIKSHSQALKVCTFNIRYDNENDGNNKWELRKMSVKDFLREELPDFIGMQEALMRQIEFLDEQLVQYDWIGVGRDDGERAGEFSPIFFDTTKWELLDDGTFWLSETPDQPSKSWDAALPRICTYGLFENKGSGDSTYVFNTHYDHVGTTARLNASRIIMEKIENMSAFRVTILMGDFNAPSESDEMKVIYNSALDDAFFKARDKIGPFGTFSGFDLTITPDRRIDYVFCSDEYEVEKYAVVDKITDGRYLSDHFPVMIHLTKN